MIPIIQSAGKTGTASDALEQYIAWLFSEEFLRGAWYDPSDMRTMFQDVYGTIPVTGLNQRVGLILDKSKGLLLGPEQIKNNSFEEGTTKWNGGSLTTPIPISNYGNITAGKFNIDFTAPSSIEYKLIYQTREFILEPFQWYKLEYKLGNYEQGNIRIIITEPSAAGDAQRIFSRSRVPESLSSNSIYTEYFFVPSRYPVTETLYNTVEIVGVTSGIGKCKYSIEYISIKKIPGNHLIADLTFKTNDCRPILKGTPNYLEFSDSLMKTLGFIMRETSPTVNRFATFSIGLDCSSTLQGTQAPTVINFLKRPEFGQGGTGYIFPNSVYNTSGPFYQLVVRSGTNKDQGYANLGKFTSTSTPGVQLGVSSGNYNLVSLGGYKLVWQSIISYAATTTAALKLKINSDPLQNSTQLINVNNLDTFFDPYTCLYVGEGKSTGTTVQTTFSGKIYSLIIFASALTETASTNVLNYINSKMPP